MAEHRNMRASDADRANIAERLRRATDEGRLLAHEFDDRLGQALNARTYGELDAIVDDLPRERFPAERPGRVWAVLRRRGPVLKAAAAAGAVAATVLVLLAPPTHVASQPAPVIMPRVVLPATLPPPPAPPRPPQPPSPPSPLATPPLP